MSPLKTQVAFPRFKTPYMTLWVHVSRLAHLCYKFGIRNGGLSNSRYIQTQDSTTGATETRTPPPVAAHAAAPTYCHAHSEPYCLYCVGKPGGYA